MPNGCEKTERACSRSHELHGGSARLRLLGKLWAVLAVVWLFIALVSALDVYCSIKYQFELIAEEMNPVGRWLMQLDGGSVALLMSCKFLGNLLAIGGLPLLYLKHPGVCVAATSVLAVVQGALATMLLGLWG